MMRLMTSRQGGNLVTRRLFSQLSELPAILLPGGHSRLLAMASRKDGQGMVEYALILVLVSIVVIVVLLTVGRAIRNVFSNVVGALG
jgi:pilus assembly protein Flp/PilA